MVGTVSTFIVEPHPVVEIIRGTLLIAPVQVLAGVNTIARVTVANHGDKADQLDLVLRIDGNFVQVQTVSVPPRGQKDVDFKVNRIATGTYQISIGGQRDGKDVGKAESGSFEVLPALLARLAYTALDASPKKVRSGEPVTLTLTSENQGQVRGSRPVVVRVDGRVANVVSAATVRVADHGKVGFAADQLTVTLEPGDKVTLELEVVERSTGEHMLSIDGKRAAFKVSRGAPWIIIIPLLVVALAAIATLAALFYYQRRRRPPTLGR